MKRSHMLRSSLLAIVTIALLAGGWARARPNPVLSDRPRAVKVNDRPGVGGLSAAPAAGGTRLTLDSIGTQTHAAALNDKSVRGPRVTGKGPLLIGYWQNFVNDAPALALGKVPPHFEVINVSFGAPAEVSSATITFAVNQSVETEGEFKRDVSGLHRRGKKVVLAIGGGDAVVQLKTSADVDHFVSSVGAIIKRFNFDGIDIDFEGESLALDQGDSDFRRPTTPTIVNLISALHRIRKMFGPAFIISFAPETFFVQAAINGYSGRQGCYLPVIYGTRTILSYVQTQDYNSGTIRGLDNNIYAGGTADFHVALTELLLQGFNVAGDASQFFPPVRPDQVVVGVPASQQAAGTSPPSYTVPSDVGNALNYLINGVPYSGHQYSLVNPAGYPGIRGLMMWSINWDAAAGTGMSALIGALLKRPPAR
jgi:chitinase